MPTRLRLKANSFTTEQEPEPGKRIRDLDKKE